MNTRPIVYIHFAHTDDSTEKINNNTAVWLEDSSAETDWHEAVMQISYASRKSIINVKLIAVYCNDLEGFRAYAAKYTSGVKDSPGVTF
jgi:hypothetical protein